MHIEWDKGKGGANVAKHGVSFETASEVFDDPLHLSLIDRRFNYFEERWITVGATKSGEILVVGHLYTISPERESIRIITARRATKKEREQYEKTA